MGRHRRGFRNALAGARRRFPSIPAPPLPHNTHTAAGVRAREPLYFPAAAVGTARPRSVPRALSSELGGSPGRWNKNWGSGEVSTQRSHCPWGARLSPGALLLGSASSCFLVHLQGSDMVSK